MFDKEYLAREQLERKIKPDRRPQRCGHAEFSNLVAELSTRMDYLLEMGDAKECLRAIRQLERAKAAYSALQTKLAYKLEKRTVEDHEFRGVHLNDQGRGCAASVAIARRRGQHGARRYLENCRMLAEDLPRLAQRFERGDLSEEQVMVILSTLADVDAEHRRDFDAYLACSPEIYEGAGTKRLQDLVRQFTCSIDAGAQTDRLHERAKRRYVRFHADQDGISISGRLPLEDGVVLEKCLRRQAHALRRKGDPRTLEQLMADLLVRRPISGDEAAGLPLPMFMDLKVIMTDRALFQGDSEPANLEGYGVIPAEYARNLVATRRRQYAQDGAIIPDRSELARRLSSFPELQRIYTAPGNKELVAMDSKARAFPDGLKELICVRDLRCRTPYCNNRPQHLDHVFAWWLGGETTFNNGDWRCAHCNYAKESPGWRERTIRDGPHTIEITTPAGISFRSLAPPATGPELPLSAKEFQQTLQEPFKD
ncbi:DUF222 domain-containing protein [Glutamicibacter sp. PS]|uniref:HNH endonuclease n=1 Tax=Glutamicibacter sp. PS TaxID=3075634 RepID=UPI002840ABD9|nr:DUF222 domain-containing protein [Glutamicibacter sp. PS]MDR4534845.1 13E12 repeat family protein [Glutamicibacter sp. PS]